MQKIRDGYKATEIGEIPLEWNLLKLGEVFEECQYGLSNPLSETGQYPVLRMNNLDAGKVKLSNLKYADLSQGEIEKYKLDKFDIVFNRTNSIDLVGKTGIYLSDEDIAFASYLIRIKVKRNKYDARFVNYYMNTKRGMQDIQKYATLGVSQANINAENLKKVNIVCPTYVEQQKIADILSTVDQQIEQTDALIEKTKELKKGLMQMLLTKGIGHTEFRDTEIGRIPKGWEVKSVGQLFDIYGGMPIPRSKLSDNGSLYLHYGDIHKRDTNYIDAEKDSDWLPRIDESEIKKTGTKLSNGDIVFADASEDYEGIGKSVVIFNQAEEVFYSGLHTIVAKSKTDELDNNYKRYCFGTKKVRSQFRAIASGATVFGISKPAIKDIKILVPPHEEQKKIAETLSAIDELITEYKIKSSELTSIKKSLMTKLLTGKMRVSY